MPKCTVPDCGYDALDGSMYCRPHHRSLDSSSKPTNIPRCISCNEVVDRNRMLCDAYAKGYGTAYPTGDTFDPARHPTHYHEGKGIDPIGVMRETFTEAELEGFFKGSALKYIMRYQSKNGKLDLEKAKNYVDLLISLYTGRIPEDGNETK